MSPDRALAMSLVNRPVGPTPMPGSVGRRSGPLLASAGFGLNRRQPSLTVMTALRSSRMPLSDPTRSASASSVSFSRRRAIISCATPATVSPCSIVRGSPATRVTAATSWG